jgi:hypothetical protein
MPIGSAVGRNDAREYVYGTLGTAVIALFAVRSSWRDFSPMSAHGTLRCSGCEEVKPRHRFRGRNKIALAGRDLLCRTCEREWHATNVRGPKTTARTA